MASIVLKKIKVKKAVEIWYNDSHGHYNYHYYKFKLLVVRVMNNKSNNDVVRYYNNTNRYMNNY